MYRFALLLIPAVAFCHQPRYARLGEFDGKAEVQVHAADAWQPVVRNMPLPQSARVQTAADSHVEIELDEGSVLRLAPESLMELSDYTRLSSGQRLTLITLDRGLAYFTGQSGRQDSLMLAVPGAQIALQRGARVRIEARDNWSQIAVIEGKVRFSSPSAEMDLAEGEMARVDPANRAKFYLYRELSPYDSDRWSEERDKVLASTTSTSHVPELRYGAQELDTGGTWVDTDTFGSVWKPKYAEGWTPYRNGRWVWYDDLGYTWISSDTWGWLPYHYGRWSHTPTLGWFWVPGRSKVFKPGEVYWARDAKLAGWGPLAPGENWKLGAMPELYLKSRTVWADFVEDVRVIDPAALKPLAKEPETAKFFLALPSPAFLASRLEATRPPLRTGATRILPVISGVAYEDAGTLAQVPTPPPIMDPPAAAPPPPPGPPVVIPTIPPPAPPIEIYYPAPVYTGVVVINPPDRGDDRRRERRNTSQPPTQPTQPTAPGPPPSSGSSTRTIADRPRAPKPIEAKPPSTPRDDNPPRDHHAPSIPVPRTDPKPPPARTPVAPLPKPGQDAKPLATPSAPASASDKDKK